MIALWTVAEVLGVRGHMLYRNISCVKRSAPESFSGQNPAIKDYKELYTAVQGRTQLYKAIHSYTTLCSVKYPPDFD